MKFTIKVRVELEWALINRGEAKELQFEHELVNEANNLNVA